MGLGDAPKFQSRLTGIQKDSLPFAEKNGKGLEGS